MGKKLVISACAVYLLAGGVLAMAEEADDPMLNFHARPANWAQRVWRVLVMPVATATRNARTEFFTGSPSTMTSWFGRVDKMLSSS